MDYQFMLKEVQLSRIDSENWMSSSCRIWDPAGARFEECFLPVIQAFPAIVASCLVFILLVRKVTGHGPRWTKPFVEELVPQPEEPGLSFQKRSSKPVNGLILVSLLGLLPQAFTLLYPSFHPEAGLLMATWMVAVVLTIIMRPQSTPFSLLALQTTLFVSHFVLLIDKFSSLRHEVVAAASGMLAALVAIVIILRMPMRDPGLPNEEISSPFQAPDPGLRSPEDNLTLWQFMTVSWMKPLIALGSTRQLNDQDVWTLSYEFQHRKLHDQFRQMRGSVLRRVLVANRVDLVFISLLGILELSAEYLMPVLLQQLLRSMEDGRAPKRAAVVYAVLSLVARLVSNQSAVFSLWFGRRAYERSRGELITMLYDKMLTRKVIGLQEKRSMTDPQTGEESKNEGTNEKSAQEKQSASMGKVLNLMRHDAYEVAQRIWEFSSLSTKPIGLVLSCILIWRLIGWPCLIGVVTVFAAQAINAFITRVLLRWERRRRIASDAKVQVVSQFVEAIRHLRWYGWQDAWLSKIMAARQHELSLRVVTSVWGILISFTNTFANGMFPVAAFYAYTYLAGQPLRIDIAFPALQLFNMLGNNLRELPGLITSLLNAYIAVGRLDAFMSEPDKADTPELPAAVNQLELRNASFAWPGSHHLVLHEVTLVFPPGLTVICGKVATGKTALLQALLGELDQRNGALTRPSRTVGYCAQSPWLQSMSIRENILFSSPYDDSRYKEVISACALTEDLANFQHGDLSNIGENGIGLSGGQKTRVALARAVYSQAEILLLDDPLSALDQQTAEVVVERCLRSPLLAGKIVVLVTHRTDICHGLAKQLVEISAGKARILAQEADSPSPLTLVRSSESAMVRRQERESEQQLAAVPDKFIEDEHRASGGVQARVYWAYIKAGKLRWWLVLICVLALYRLVAVGQTWFLKQWGEAYDINIRPWLIAFFIIAATQAAMFFFTRCVMLVIIYTAGRRMFREIMQHVSCAKFRFYDVTPVGRLMNRLTSDIGTIDGNISEQFHSVAWLVIEWVSSIAVIASITPGFLVFSCALTVGFALIFLRFLPTSQSLRRLEMVSLSPLLSNFGALSEGLTTVRAFCAQHRFQSRVIDSTDLFQKMDHFYWSLQAWLMYRFTILSSFSTLLLTLVALYSGVSPGLTAFLLVAASKFVTSTHLLCKQYGQLQMDFVSVERVVEMLRLEQESSRPVKPPAWWPSFNGDVVFKDVTIRYAPQFDPALTSISLSIKAGSNTAIIGRTGSGKSTLALALLATTLPESGRILIDGIDISTVDTQALRSRVTFLAQEPLLFPGSLRQNLDPLDQYADAECESVIGKVCEQHHQWTLDTQIDTGGHNLSQGQRQLIGLARAVLRRSPVVILDEATASIDLETALRIQRILREEMSQSTVITIAHRLEAVRNADHCILLGDGRLIDQGSPADILQRVHGQSISSSSPTSTTTATS